MEEIYFERTYINDDVEVSLVYETDEAAEKDFILAIVKFLSADVVLYDNLDWCIENISNEKFQKIISYLRQKNII